MPLKGYSATREIWVLKYQLLSKVKLFKESQEETLAWLIALEKNQRRGMVNGDQSDEEEKGGDGNNPPDVVQHMREPPIDPKELIMVRMLKVVKGDSVSMVKVEVPMYGGKRDSEELLTWIDVLDNFFEYEEVEDTKKVRYAKIKLKALVLTWWNFVQEERVKGGKEKILSWDIMVSKLKAQFLPVDCVVQTFRKLHNLKQKDMDVMSYTEEFHKLTLRSGHHEMRWRRLQESKNNKEEVGEEIFRGRGSHSGRGGQKDLGEKNTNQESNGDTRGSFRGRRLGGRGRFSGPGRGSINFLGKCYNCNQIGCLAWKCLDKASTSSYNGDKRN
ncbi:hypothetical protein SUGI_0854920 [Cryptomeria japonica]|nr:hypothetical protein SUGI_0854920 [Cryptomeria japonica]